MWDKEKSIIIWACLWTIELEVTFGEQKYKMGKSDNDFSCPVRNVEV